MAPKMKSPSADISSRAGYNISIEVSRLAFFMQKFR
jgi:hypothetical protein